MRNASWVRIPLLVLGLVVKLVITADFESVIPSSSLGRTFWRRLIGIFARLTQLVEYWSYEPKVAGSRPASSTSGGDIEVYSSVTQWSACRPHKPTVVGSNPTRATRRRHRGISVLWCNEQHILIVKRKDIGANPIRTTEEAYKRHGSFGYYYY